MNTLNELTSYLDIDFGTDHWSDDACLLAQSMVERLTEPEWVALQRNWRSHRLAWQERLAYVVSWNRSMAAVPILLAMVEEEGDELSIRAADSLRDYVGLVDASILTTKAAARLEALAGKGKLNALVVADLHKQLAQPPGFGGLGTVVPLVPKPRTD